MEYEIPNPEQNPVKALVIFYKVEKGFEYDDKSWDKIHFGRCMRASKDLLEICQTFGQAKRCIQEISRSWEEKDLCWSLETIVKHSHEWVLKNGRKNDGKNRARFSDALAKSRASFTGQSQGASITSGEMLKSLRNLEVLQPENGNQRREADSANGSSGK